MNKTHIRTYTKALVEAAMHKATALQIELTVGLAVMHECQPSKRLGRETLLTIYNGAGWTCAAPGALDWRAVNRRITATIALYDFLGEDLTQAADGHKAQDLIEAIQPLVAALKVKSVNEVLLACDKVRAPRKPAVVHGTRIDAGHIHVVIPESATQQDILTLASKLMEMISERFEQPAAAQAEDAKALTGEEVAA